MDDSPDGTMAEASRRRYKVDDLMSTKPMLDRLLKIFYNLHPRPDAIRLTVAQANQINDEMQGWSSPRLVISRDMDMLVLGHPVEWVDDETNSILNMEAARG